VNCKIRISINDIFVLIGQLIENGLLHFYPRDAMLARVLAMALCLCLSVSVTSRCSIETDERIGLVFGRGSSLDLSCSVF